MQSPHKGNVAKYERTLTCVNCDERLDAAKLFCSDICHDEADFVRYVRRRIRDGTAAQPDIKDVIRIRRAHIISGGYQWRARQLTQRVKEAIFRRDEGRCRSCDRPGSEIDHIKGCSNELENLQLLCCECHIAKTKAGLVPLSPTDEEYLAKVYKARELEHRCRNARALRICDDDEVWPQSWRRILKARKSIEHLTAFGYISMDEVMREWGPPPEDDD
jgi:5-methylcytosine-specific restriction endonuclease McrA